jgi:putative Ig domain-containing protein
MSRFAKGFVSLLLPAVAIALVHGCGGGAPETAARGEPPAGTASTPVTPSTANAGPTIKNVTADEYARIGETYSFLPVATNAGSDSLRFSATNLPPWASVDPNNGRISGTPGPGDEGVYESVVIAVSESGRRASTAPFNIVVLGDAASGVATLRWEAPPSKLDGSPLDDLAGYRILYGRKAEDLDQSVLIDDPAITSYEFTTLAKGIWYFAVVGVNSGGLEGPPTVISSKSI